MDPQAPPPWRPCGHSDGLSPQGQPCPPSPPRQPPGALGLLAGEGQEPEVREAELLSSWFIKQLMTSGVSLNLPGPQFPQQLRASSWLEPALPGQQSRELHLSSGEASRPGQAAAGQVRSDGYPPPSRVSPQSAGGPEPPCVCTRWVWQRERPGGPQGAADEREDLVMQRRAA